MKCHIHLRQIMKGQLVKMSCAIVLFTHYSSISLLSLSCSRLLIDPYTLMMPKREGLKTFKTSSTDIIHSSRRNFSIDDVIPELRGKLCMIIKHLIIGETYKYDLCLKCHHTMETLCTHEFCIWLIRVGFRQEFNLLRFEIDRMYRPWWKETCQGLESSLEACEVNFHV